MDYPIVFVPPTSRAVEFLDEVEGLCQALCLMLGEPIAIVVADTASLQEAASNAGQFRIVDPMERDF